jgi:hypothetical protein
MTSTPRVPGLTGGVKGFLRLYLCSGSRYLAACRADARRICAVARTNAHDHRIVGERAASRAALVVAAPAERSDSTYVSRAGRRGRDERGRQGSRRRPEREQSAQDRTG